MFSILNSRLLQRSFLVRLLQTAGLSLALMTASAATPTFAATYEATVLPDVGGGTGNGYAHGLDNAGNIVGSSSGDATLWSSDGTPNLLPNAAAGQGGVAIGINSLGYSVGISYTNSGGSPVIWSP
jgi:hypothetical protein